MHVGTLSSYSLILEKRQELIKYCDKNVRYELTTDDMLEMAEKVNSTTEEAATPIKKPRLDIERRICTSQNKTCKRWS